MGSDSSASRGTSRSEFLGLYGPYKHTSIRVYSKLWAWFVDYCQKTGSSTCRHLTGYMLGLKKAVEACASPTTTIEHVVVHVHPVRMIKRHRRVVHEVDEIVEPPFPGVIFGKCFGCGVSDGKLFRAKFVSGLVADVCESCLEGYKRRTLVRQILWKPFSDRTGQY